MTVTETWDTESGWDDEAPSLDDELLEGELEVEDDDWADDDDE
jgi:hypothetical protein